jgi:thiamine-phosphate pyrophosphorylase
MHILAISPDRDMDTSRWEAVARSGIDALLLRERRLDVRALLVLGRMVLDMARGLAPGLELWIGGRLDVALALGAGFHGGEDCPDVPPSLCPVSRPLHDASQIRERAGCHQLLISPVFDVPGKGGPLGAVGLHKILDKMPTAHGRLLALGGIRAENAAALRHPRLDGVALIRSVWDVADPRDTVEGLRNAWKEDEC